ncbi:hypothetical protein [Lysobacter capsici]|uniref:hypothetical protein n=1 Tax=Lysobacter capsici TaxID=435897 RepID=UPI001C0060E5|nr:hypothetical protein [Lysobacter capsici]QWF15056.1 hypothetical protein KME82_14720 [Lysobacter capsici]
MNHSIARWALWPLALALALSACGGSGDEGKVAERAVARTTSDATANPSATSASAAAGGFDFATWVAANAACKGEYFADVQDPAFAHTLSAAGIEVSADSTIGEVGPGGGSLTPRAPTRLHGLPIVRVDYDFGSGSTFAVVVHASAEQARAAIGAQPLAEIYREYYRLGVPTAAPSEDTPMPDIQFVRDGDKPGTQEIGCAAFDM